MNTEDQYTEMQINQYETQAKIAQVSPGIIFNDSVVGAFEQHNKWSDYQEFLFKHDKLKDTKNMIVLDFACGPGRNILLFKDKFKRIDGVDMGKTNLENAKIYTSEVENPPILYHCNGRDLKNVPSNIYDIVFSTIALQHICCHSIRFNYLKEFKRVLKDGGFICLQMGFGNPYHPDMRTHVKYNENLYSAFGTNGQVDTRVENPNEIKNDLDEIGFKEFQHTIRPAGPGDANHPNWIFFSAFK